VNGVRVAYRRCLGRDFEAAEEMTFKDTPPILQSSAVTGRPERSEGLREFPPTPIVYPLPAQKAPTPVTYLAEPHHPKTTILSERI
jgi:hypothetical protein